MLNHGWSQFHKSLLAKEFFFNFTRNYSRQLLKELCDLFLCLDKPDFRILVVVVVATTRAIPQALNPGSEPPPAGSSRGPMVTGALASLGM